MRRLLSVLEITQSSCGPIWTKLSGFIYFG